MLLLEGRSGHNGANVPRVIDNAPESIFGAPVLFQSSVVELLQNDEIDHIGHVVVLDAEVGASEAAALPVHHTQFEADEPRRPNLDFHADHAAKLLHVNRVLLLLVRCPGQSGLVQLVHVSLLNGRHVELVALTKVDHLVAHLRHVR